MNERTTNQGRESYAYVSLFGLNSLDDLRNAIFASRVKASEIEGNDPLSVLENNTKGLLQYLNLLPKLKDWSAVASTAAFHMVTNTLPSVPAELVFCRQSSEDRFFDEK